MDKLKPILSESDYDRALAEIKRLWGAKSGTPEGDRLGAFATLVSNYEDEHYPMGTADSSAIVKK